mgnify:CR=1 FL=1
MAPPPTIPSPHPTNTMKENHNDLRAFLAVAGAGSFTRAAKTLGVSPSALSHSIRGIEARLHIKLFHRSTRSIAMTEAGEWLRKRLIIHWREQMSEQFHQAWLEDHKHYRLQLTGEPDNPDQRIAEDIALLASQSLELVRSFISKSITSSPISASSTASPACKPSPSPGTKSPSTATSSG